MIAEALIHQHSNLFMAYEVLNISSAVRAKMALKRNREPILVCNGFDPSLSDILSEKYGLENMGVQVTRVHLSC